MPLKDIEQFQLQYLQVLDESGTLDKDLEPDLDRDRLIELYRGMLYARRADERQLKLQRQGRMGTFGPCTGQEAAVCAPVLAMTAKDWFVGAFRELGGRLMRGVNLTEEYLFWNGFEEGNVTPDAPNTLPNTVIVGSQLPHAVGIAYAMKYRKEKAAVVTFCGDGATSQGDFHEALNFASVWQAPVVFIVVNNQWAISIPRARQTHSRTIAQKGIAYDIPSLQVDGNDALAVYRAANEALERARSGGGPSLIEAVTYRLMMHTTADDPTKYRRKEQEEEWWRRDPLPRFQKYLEAKKIWTPELERELEDEIRTRIEKAVTELESRSDFKPDAPFDHVFGTTHPIIEEQRREFLSQLAEEAGGSQAAPESSTGGAGKEAAHA